ncbi:MAG: flagellar hook-basal body complex protein FliE [Spirochaetales bacterium]|nr:flagellar hook-basal body complex protein FliE [Spirochaetales bacterium]
MAFLSALQVHGDAVNISRTHPKHIGGVTGIASSPSGNDFEDLLIRALNGVNRIQLESDQLGTQMLTDPDSVETHDVTIAMAKANLALSITKSVVDRAISAYTSIINIR